MVLKVQIEESCGAANVKDLVNLVLVTLKQLVEGYSREVNDLKPFRKVGNCNKLILEDGRHDDLGVGLLVVTVVVSVAQGKRQSSTIVAR
jgi:hypothetical protein